jgi:hypothetical protein
MADELTVVDQSSSGTEELAQPLDLSLVPTSLSQFSGVLLPTNPAQAARLAPVKRLRRPGAALAREVIRDFPGFERVFQPSCLLKQQQIAMFLRDRDGCFNER